MIDYLHIYDAVFHFLVALFLILHLNKVYDNTVLAIFVTIGIGVGNELYDWIYENHFCGFDLLFDFLGLLMGLYIIVKYLPFKLKKT